MPELAVLRMALRAILANRLRSLLTILGVVIGVAAVVALVSLGQGATSRVTGAVEGLGTNLLVISPGGVTATGFIPPDQAPISLTQEEELAQAVPAVRAMAPSITRQETVAYGSQSASLPVEATTPAILDIRSLHVAEGRFFTPSQEQEAAPVVVLGAQAADDLFGSPLPPQAVGSQVTIGGMPFTVEGVLATQGQSGTTNLDQVVYVPLSTAMEELFGQVPLSAIYASARSPQDMTMAQEEIQAALSAIEQVPPGSPPPFTITSQTQVLSTLSTITGTLTTFLGAVAGISLLVGGIGIMNIMLVSVTERTREIGVRKAVGARRADILGQFILEAVLLSLSGGVLGIGVGALLTKVGARLVGSATVSGVAVALALVFSAAVGIVFGAYPAVRASRLMPMQALRYE